MSSADIVDEKRETVLLEATIELATTTENQDAALHEPLALMEVGLDDDFSFDDIHESESQTGSPQKPTTRNHSRIEAKAKNEMLEANAKKRKKPKERTEALEKKKRQRIGGNRHTSALSRYDSTEEEKKKVLGDLEADDEE
jgi:hypothetical protein